MVRKIPRDHMEKARIHPVYLGSGSEEGLRWNLRISLSEGTKNFTGHFVFGGAVDRVRGHQRLRDREWVAHNIPSSIWWGLEIHHDWENGARMYLLSKEEHKKRTRDEKHKKGA